MISYLPLLVQGAIHTGRCSTDGSNCQAARIWTGLDLYCSVAPCGWNYNNYPSVLSSNLQNHLQTPCVSGPHFARPINVVCRQDQWTFHLAGMHGICDLQSDNLDSVTLCSAHCWVANWARVGFLCCWSKALEFAVSVRFVNCLMSFGSKFNESFNCSLFSLMDYGIFLDSVPLNSLDSIEHSWIYNYSTNASLMWDCRL